MITYTRNVKDDKPATYDCCLCGNYAEDVDSARAHHAVHVAGPDLLSAAKALLETRGMARGLRGVGSVVQYKDLVSRTRIAGDQLAAVVAKLAAVVVKGEAEKAQDHPLRPIPDGKQNCPDCGTPRNGGMIGLHPCSGASEAA